VKCRLAFGLASDDLFFVTASLYRPVVEDLRSESKVATFRDENEFLELLIAADLGEEHTVRLILAVLLSVASPTAPPAWIDVDLTRNQIDRLQLNGLSNRDLNVGSIEGNDPLLTGPESRPQFYDLLMQAPVPIAMLLGAEHRFAFINKRYAELIGAKSISSLLGKTMLEAFPELEEQRFIELLDRAYETGTPLVLTERRCTFFRETTGAMEEGHFDSVFQPIRNALGEISGIMIQTTDVTQQVLERGVRENRETLLYRQWAELNSIYDNAPIGLILIETRDFRILRLNERQAALMGGSASDFLGKPIWDVVHDIPELPELFDRVIAGQMVDNHILEGELASSPGVHRYWLVNYAPTYSEDGKVEAITAVSLEISSQTKADILLCPKEHWYAPKKSKVLVLGV
jgi:PAS domain S-box-containing protein